MTASNGSASRRRGSLANSAGQVILFDSGKSWFLIANLGRRRTSTVNEGAARLNVSLDTVDRWESVNVPSHANLVAHNDSRQSSRRTAYRPAVAVPPRLSDAASPRCRRWPPRRGRPELPCTTAGESESCAAHPRRSRSRWRSKVLVATGGPGVGKTSIVNSLVRILGVKSGRRLLCRPAAPPRG